MDFIYIYIKKATRYFPGKFVSGNFFLTSKQKNTIEWFSPSHFVTSVQPDQFTLDFEKNSVFLAVFLMQCFQPDKGSPETFISALKRK